MSLSLNFEPHSWYMGFAIKQNFDPKGWTCDYKTHDMQCNNPTGDCCKDCPRWTAYTDDGNTYRIVDLDANTVKRLKSKIRQYHLRKHNGYGEQIAKRRLEYLRKQVIGERISYGELAELQALANYIDPRDLDLLEAAAVQE